MKFLKNENDGFVSPLQDFAFAQIFGEQRNIGFTRDFLKTFLDIPKNDYDKLTVETPTLKRFLSRDKAAMVDLKLSTKSGRIIHIELQVEKRSNMKDRITYYLTRLISDQLKWGDDYKLNQVISIVICDHTLLEEEKSYINSYELRNKYGNSFTKQIKLVIIELPKLPKEEDADGALWPWLQFFKCKSMEDFDMLAKKHPELEKPIYCARRMSLPELWRDYWLHEKMRKWDEWGLKEQARIDGHAEGHAAGFAEGRAEGRTEGQAEGQAEKSLQIARKMKSRGQPLAEIAEITDLPIETIEQL